ncbi:hypothetical protein ISN07_000992 [Listeria monocytogenes]|nr:hypothetical protein [Listeria monocytogenes]EEO6481479.1 hypothetical protein [Listeria monocytogenes]EFU9651266.1 hypothetical protein [Listeria monocytogenes]EGC7676175.1 hypothetical protein [Listeria monocytogenes]EGN7537407.1 hypothetical protein [Listeria monocytogenes]
MESRTYPAPLIYQNGIHHFAGISTFTLRLNKVRLPGFIGPVPLPLSIRENILEKPVS